MQEPGFETLGEIYERMLAKDPNDRPTANQLLASPTIQRYFGNRPVLLDKTMTGSY